METRWQLSLRIEQRSIKGEWSGPERSYRKSQTASPKLLIASVDSTSVVKVSSSCWLAENPGFLICAWSLPDLIFTWFWWFYDYSFPVLPSFLFLQYVCSFFWSEWRVYTCTFLFLLPFSKDLKSTRWQLISSATQQIVIFIINAHLLQSEHSAFVCAWCLKVRFSVVLLSCSCALMWQSGNIMGALKKTGCILMLGAFQQEVDSCFLFNHHNKEQQRTKLMWNH